MSIIANICLAIYITSTVAVALYCAMQFHLMLKFFRHIKPNTDYLNSFPLIDNNLPIVTVQLPIFNEKMVVNKLIDNITKLDYPKDKLQIQILDDSTDETIALSISKQREYEALGYDIALIHRENRSGYKAGALAHGLTLAKGEFIFIFDADFLPKPNFIGEVLPYFQNPKIGAVQTRWEHTNQKENLLTELQAMQLNVHFTVEQAGRYNSAYFLQFNGTAGAWRKTSIIAAGGWQADTLTEDLDLSYRAQLRGDEIQYLWHIISPSELPSDIAGLKSQQYRWMKGGAETARKIIPRLFTSSTKIAKKINGLGHLLGSSVYLAVFMMAFVSVMLVPLQKHIHIDLSILSLFMASLVFIASIYYVANVHLIWVGKSYLKKAVKFIALFPVFLAVSMGLSLHNSIAVLHGWLGIKTGFIRTPKKGDSKKTLTSYKQKTKSYIFILECLLLLYFIGGLYLGYLTKNTSFYMFHGLLSVGYGIVVWYEMKEML
jgi:cellulose synthase/poly-beta-1,6-N-acetylglucosamine synthase-like glycosyltransferase